jgi:hypothetical protein
MQKVIVFIIIAILVLLTNNFLREKRISASQSITPAQKTANATTAPPNYRCDGRIYCSQMTSCEEAKFFLQNCPGVKMDGNQDGVPCESQWCH